MSETRIQEIGNVGIPISDQDRALEFYVNTLGFEKRRDEPFGPGLRWIEVAPKGATTTVALAPSPEGAPIGVDTGIRFLTEDAETDYTGLTAKGVQLGEFMRWPGVPPMFTFQDPDGNTLYIVQKQ